MSIFGAYGQSPPKSAKNLVRRRIEKQSPRLQRVNINLCSVRPAILVISFCCALCFYSQQTSKQNIVVIIVASVVIPKSSFHIVNILHLVRISASFVTMEIRKHIPSYTKFRLQKRYTIAGAPCEFLQLAYSVKRSLCYRLHDVYTISQT